MIPFPEDFPTSQDDDSRRAGYPSNTLPAFPKPLAATEYSIERGLPAAVDAERSILGAVLLDAHSYNQAAESLHADDFSLDSHRRIFSRMMDLDATGRPIDIITLQEELSRHKELEAIGGVAYLASLTDGVPRRPSIEHYVRMVRDKALLRGLINAANIAISSALDQADPAEEILDAAEAAIFQVSDKRLGRGFVTIPQIVQDSFGSPDALIAPGAHITGLETHFKLFDEKTRGMQKSDLIIVAARPSMGKTAFAMNIAENVAVLDKKTVAVFSLEMSREALLRRLLFCHARVDAYKMTSGFVTREDTRKLATALTSLSEAPIFIDDTPGISVHEMRAKARRLKQQQQGNLDLIVVDYLQLMAATPIGGKRFENRTQEVSAISRGLKALAKELNVPVIALSQLSRAPEARGGDHRPQLSDLRESGSIEQDADLVAFLFREEYYKKDDPELDGIAELIIGKQRNGPTGTIRLAFRKNFTRFDTLAEEQDARAGEGF
ncbi:MAG TPA: replicative DNA helicase [Terriglobales bacterium]|nr:replicative DNA helicase [Terriglobales bacterium]